MSLSDVYMMFNAVRCSDSLVYGFVCPFPDEEGYGSYRFKSPVSEKEYLDLMSRLVNAINDPENQRPGLDLRWFPTRKEAALWVAKGEDEHP